MRLYGDAGVIATGVLTLLSLFLLKCFQNQLRHFIQSVAYPSSGILSPCKKLMPIVWFLIKSH